MQFISYYKTKKKTNNYIIMSRQKQMYQQKSQVDFCWCSPVGVTSPPSSYFPRYSVYTEDPAVWCLSVSVGGESPPHSVQFNVLCQYSCVNMQRQLAVCCLWQAITLMFQVIHSFVLLYLLLYTLFNAIDSTFTRHHGNNAFQTKKLWC